MVSRLATLAAVVTIVTLSMLMADCNSGGGSRTLTLYVSMSDFDDCVEEYVTLNLAKAGASIARNPQGEPDCTLRAGLASRGCTFRAAIGDDGDLGVAIKSCPIGTAASLFSCQFTDADISEFAEKNTECGCLTRPSSCYVNGICNVCVSGKDDRQGCELCDNNVDDDGDHKIDCDDPDCELTEECGFGRSTLQCSSTTTTSTASTLPSPRDATRPAARIPGSPISPRR